MYLSPNDKLEDTSKFVYTILNFLKNLMYNKV